MKMITFEDNILFKSQTKRCYIYLDKNYLKFFISDRKLKNKQYIEISKNTEYENKLKLVITAYNKAVMNKENSDLIFYLLSYINSY